MLVVMEAHATEQQIRAVCQRIESAGMKAHPIQVLLAQPSASPATRARWTSARWKA